MLLPADLLRAVDHDLFNQFIYCRGIKLLQIGIPVGKLKETFYREACVEYEKRLKGYCRLEIAELTEQRLPERPSQAQVDAALHKEAEAIRAKILSGSQVIAMCIEGKQLSSEQLADRLDSWMSSGTSQICILIGSSCGMDEALKQSAPNSHL